MTTSKTTKKFEIIAGKQKRLFSLILLLDAGLDRSTEGLARALTCSTPTFHRLLAELRTNYDMDVTYNPDRNQYEITSYGCVTDSVISAIGTILAGEQELVESLDPAAVRHYTDGHAVHLDEATIQAIDDISAQSQQRPLSRRDIIAGAIDILNSAIGLTKKK